MCAERPPKAVHRVVYLTAAMALFSRVARPFYVLFGIIHNVLMLGLNSYEKLNASHERHGSKVAVHQHKRKKTVLKRYQFRQFLQFLFCEVSGMQPTKRSCFEGTSKSTVLSI
jgi:CRISPR/Cas system-associated exonuclease Cas4 (RecB family)